jgi:hypothetical protein
MNGTAARQEAKKILAELPDRISDVIKPFVRHNHNTTIVLGGIIHAHVRSVGVEEQPRRPKTAQPGVPFIGLWECRAPRFEMAIGS